MTEWTHVQVTYAFGHRQIVQLASYMAAPAVFYASTHARLMTRTDVIRERMRARNQRIAAMERLFVISPPSDVPTPETDE